MDTPLSAPSTLSRFLPPRLPEAVIERHNLVKHITQLRRITLISAPAGAGKTTLAIQLVQRIGVEQTRWITLMDDDNDPIRCVLSLASACGDDIADQLPTVIGLARERREAAAALQVLVAALHDRQSPLLLVLDDLQCLSDPAVLRLLTQVIDQSPAAVRWLLVSREQPALPLARWRLRDELLEIDEGDLRADHQVVTELVQRWGLQVNAADVTELVERSQGWFAGLQLALIAAQRSANSARVLAHLSGHNSFLAEYLIDEVLDQLPAELQEFLLICSIVPQLQPDLCAAVSGRSDAAQLLRLMVQRNLFVRRLGDSDWYSMHQLFAEVLLRELRVRLPADELAELYRRAADWYLRHHDTYRAACSLRDGGRSAEAAALVRRCAWRSLMTVQLAETARLLSILPESLRAADGGLLIVQAWAAFAERDDQQFETAILRLDGLTAEQLTPHDADEYATLHLLIRYLRGDHTVLCADCISRLAVLQPASQHARGWVNFLVAMTHRPQVTGEQNPQRFIDRAADAFRQCGALYAEPYLTGIAAALWRNMGQPEACLAYCRNTLAYFTRHLSIYTAPEAHYTLHILAAEIAYWRDDIAQSVEHLTVLADMLRIPTMIGTLGRLETLLRLEACAQVQPLAEPAHAALQQLRSEEQQLWNEIWQSDARTSIAACLLLQIERLWRDGRHAAVWSWFERFDLSIEQLDDQSPDMLWLVLITARVAARRNLEALTPYLEQQLARSQAIGSVLLHQRLSLLAAVHAAALGRHASARQLLRRTLLNIQRDQYLRMVLDIPELVPLLRAIGTRYADRLVERILAGAPLDQRFTPQERRIIGRMLHGDDHHRISIELAVTPSTVKWHMNRIYTKLGVHSREEAVAKLRNR